MSKRNLDIEEIEAGVDNLREPFRVQCLSCRKIHVFDVGHADFYDWQHGKHAQEAFPYLSAAERELMISRTCGPCFDKMFPPED